MRGLRELLILKTACYDWSEILDCKLSYTHDQITEKIAKLT